ncbi:MAG: DUF1501 domain-containing protein [Acidimicrobiales bacterium]
MTDPTTPLAARFPRRRFLIGAGAAAGAALAGGALAGGVWTSGATAPASARRGPGGAGGPLVLVALYGGNDGLNTVIPIDDPAYHAARPTLGYTAEQVLPLSEGLALNGQLKGFKSLWDAGQLAIVRGVGYPNPSLSHFESMDIWQTANPTDGVGSGWLGRWLDATGNDPLRALSVGATLPPDLRGERSAASAITGGTVRLPGGAKVVTAVSRLVAPGTDRGPLAAQVASSGSDLLQVRQDLDQLHLVRAAPAPATGHTGGPAPGAPVSAQSNDLAGQLALVASLIRSGAPTKVYQVSLASFDTHASEKSAHERMLGELDHAVSSFFASLHGTPHGGGTVLATFSEFGRRPVQNASGGTDHGAAAPLFIAGPGVRGGKFYGEEPSLTALDANGNLRYNVDFRSVYATLLERVVGVDPVPFLGSRWPLLELL